jgi:hypothetical protein
MSTNWKIVNRGPSCFIDDERGSMVAKIYQNDHAPLIAVAPDLLGLVETLVALSNLIGAEDFANKASSLIASAKVLIVKARK